MLTFDKLVFKDNGDGTVTVTMPDSYPIQMAFPKQDDGPGSIKLTVSQPAAPAIIAGEAPPRRSDKITAPETKITLDEVTGQDGKVLETTGDLALSGLEGKLPGHQDR